MEARTRQRLRANARRFNRMRWLEKAAAVRNRPGGTASRADKLRYVLWSPELGDHSFEIADSAALAAFLAQALEAPVERVSEALAEAEQDSQLQLDYARLRRPSLLPRRLSLSQRAVWWAIVRLRRPRLVVETGVWYGLGSAVLLRALELNAAEGHPGELLSFDPDTTGGWLVPARVRGRWTWVHAATQDALEPLLGGRAVDFFIHDTPSDHARERLEFQVAHRHAAPGAVLLSANGDNTPALEELCEREGLAYRHHTYLPRRHFYVTNGVSLTVLPPQRQQAV